jgi:F420-non-reducing hydrogenase iron-sulfur subunit
MDKQDSKSGVYVYFCGNGEHGRQLPTALSTFAKEDGAHLEAMPCTGKIDPRYILKAFESGAKAVFVLACPLGHCKTLEGNLRAIRRVELAREMLSEAGLNPEAVRIYLPSTTEQDTLDAAVQAVALFIKNIRQAEEALA